jgi:hypothetical protein
MIVSMRYISTNLLLELFNMKWPLVAGSAVLTLVFAGATLADDSVDNATASAASDSTVMTQAKDTKAEKKKAQQNTKGGRPLSSKPASTSN